MVRGRAWAAQSGGTVPPYSHSIVAGGFEEMS
jgi:hypothetical protein